MKYPMFKVHVDVEKALENLRKVLESGYLNEGEQVANFKKKLSNYFNHKNVIPLNSCTSALTLALKLSNVEAGTEVITTAMTCVASNTPILSLGAKVVWADIDKNTGNIDPTSVKKLITNKTRAVICVNWAGNPCNLNYLQKICNDNNLKLIQDAAHSFGAYYKSKHVCHFSDFTCYSFQAIKHITTGDGGALVCNDKNDYDRGNKLKWFGIDRNLTKNEKGEWKGQRWEVDVEEAGYKLHMNNISAAIGLAQIPYFDSIISSHRRNANLYNEAFKDFSMIYPLKIENDSVSSNWVYTFLINESIDRNEVLEILNSKGVNAGTVHVPNHNYTCFKENFSSLPQTEYFAKHQISLPCGWWLESKDVNIIADTVKNTLSECYKKYYYGEVI